MDIFSPTILDNASITGSNNTILLQVSSPTASAALFISGSGNVGIGLLTSSARLHMSGANNQSLLRVSSPSASAALFVQGDGNVGIGTETPTGAIDIFQGGNSRILVTAGSGFVGLQQSSPAEYIHITSDPASTKYIQIDAASSQTPPTTAIVPDTGYGNTSNKIYLAEPDYWMEIKLNGNIVLIPCYLPA